MRSINIFIFLGFVLFPYLANSQQWQTIGGNNMKNGLSLITGPSTYEIVWTVEGSNTLWGNSVFTCGNLFATSRILFSPYRGIAECRSLEDGSLLWDFQPTSSSIIYVIGFNEHAVYVHDYNDDILYALDPLSGEIKWQRLMEYLFGGDTGLVFTDEGNPYFTNYLLCRKTGDIIWYNDYPTPVLPDAGFATDGQTIYHYTGFITTPKRIIAIDIEQGTTKYETFSLPGDGDQELPLIVGPDNRIYMTRDGGKFHAFYDNGNEFIEVFNSDIAFEWRVAIDIDSNIVGYFEDKLYKIDYNTGDIIASTPFNLGGSMFSMITIDAEGKKFVNTSEGNNGKIMCISSDLQNIIFEIPAPFSYYCDANLNKNGLMVITQKGTEIFAVRDETQIESLPPVADFFTWTRDIDITDVVDFYDNSSFSPNSWEWFFEGGNPEVSFEQNPGGIQYSASGSFLVSLTVSNGHGTSTIIKNRYINIEVNTHVSDAYADFITVFPNPSSNFLYVSLKDLSHNIFQFELRDIMGNLVFQKEVNNQVSEIIDMSLFATGIYTLRVTNGQHSYTKKVIKM